MRTYLKTCRHGNFLLLHGDMISEYLNLYGEWCESEIDLYSTILLPTSNVIEIGANLGAHAVPLAKICHKGQIMCFEPQRIIFQMLNANIALNNIINAHTRLQAVGSESSQITIATSDYSTPWNYGSFSLTAGFNREGQFKGQVSHETVGITAIDDVPELESWSNITMIKIDVEGAEFSVLKGAERTIERHRPAIFIENNNPEVGDQLISTIRQMNYECYWFLSSRYRPNNFNQATWTIKGYDINMICFPVGSPMNLNSSLSPASSVSQLDKGLPIYM